MRDDDLWVITCYPVWNAWKSIAGVIVLVVFLLGAYYLGLINPRIFKYFLWVVPACLLLIGMSIRRHIAHPEQLDLAKKSIYYRHWRKQTEWVVDQLPLDSVCNISVKSSPDHFRTAGDIVIEGKEHSVWVVVTAQNKDTHPTFTPFTDCQ